MSGFSVMADILLSSTVGGAVVGSGVKADHREGAGSDDEAEQVSEFGGHGGGYQKVGSAVQPA